MYEGEISEPADETKVKRRREVDVKECYRRRRVHSAGDKEGFLHDLRRACCLYLSAAGPKSLGNRTGSALECVSDLGILFEFGW